MSMSDPLNHLGSIWYHSEALEVLYCPNQFLGLDFFCSFLQQTGSKKRNACIIKIASDCQALWTTGSTILTKEFQCIIF